ncbi:hypothetical protein [Clostridium botulinum]|uniref:hypothetical protein n=1 Tax=Clostridium botulinum TaxID=1491 RepID=UPI0007732118|nr:hypothetical protein [Clostridium botulinum]MBY6932115.1 hypothetical protein [Clostridium botulinum]NFG20332.1 hypothetical protein [Clostridium botulinum]NFO82477.1 hypothetical protein [Clostridium botulinum]
MSDNWLALVIAVLSPKEIHVSDALMKAGVTLPRRANKIVITDKQFKKIEKLNNKKVGWSQIAKILEMDVEGQRLREKFYSIKAKKEKATKEPTKVSEVAQQNFQFHYTTKLEVCNGKP